MIYPAAEDWLLNTLRHGPGEGRLAEAANGTAHLLEGADPQFNKPEFGVASDFAKAASQTRSSMHIAQIAPLTESIPPKLYGGTERVVSWLTDELVSLSGMTSSYSQAGIRTLRPTWNLVSRKHCGWTARFVLGREDSNLCI
jgi:hypothetical protein